MPRASKREVGKELKKELVSTFSDLIATLQSSSEIDEFLNSFLTQEEKIMVSKRLMLYVMFDKNYKTADIAKFLKMSRVTVIRHRNKWYAKNNSFKLMLGKLMGRKKAKKVWDTVENLLYPLDLMLRSRNDMKARAKLYQGDVER